MREHQAIQRMREVIRRQHKALATEATYVHGLRHYMAAPREMPPALSNERKLERFLTELALKGDVAAATQNQAFNAVAFFYRDVLGNPLHDVDALRATRPAHLRHAPTVGETRAVLQAVPDLAGYPTNLIARTSRPQCHAAVFNRWRPCCGCCARVCGRGLYWAIQGIPQKAGKTTEADFLREFEGSNGLARISHEASDV